MTEHSRNYLSVIVEDTVGHGAHKTLTDQQPEDGTVLFGLNEGAMSLGEHSPLALIAGPVYRMLFIPDDMDTRRKLGVVACTQPETFLSFAQFNSPEDCVEINAMMQSHPRTVRKALVTATLTFFSIPYDALYNTAVSVADQLGEDESGMVRINAEACIAILGDSFAANLKLASKARTLSPAEVERLLVSYQAQLDTRYPDGCEWDLMNMLTVVPGPADVLDKALGEPA